MKNEKTKRRIALYADPSKDRFSNGENFPDWNGTAVGIDISLDTTMEISTLFDLIRKLF